MNKWLVASYKINQVARLELNLQNQKFDYYLPKIVVKEISINLKEELMFPGYVFINTDISNYASLKYTKGINKILKFGNNIPFMANDDIKAIMEIEKKSKNININSNFYYIIWDKENLKYEIINNFFKAYKWDLNVELLDYQMLENQLCLMH